MLNAWKPILFASEFSNNNSAPKQIRLWDKNYVVWKSGSDNFNIIPDKCIHRAARLSGGRVVDGCIECPYHGWRFDGTGQCTRIPQSATLPKIGAINSTNDFVTSVHDGIVWVARQNMAADGFDRSHFNFTEHPEFIVTDRAYDTNYSYFLQIENLLDPAHINFVHDGFQGDREKAGVIQLDDLVVTQSFMSATFSHPGQKVPKVMITFWMPFVIEVSVFDAEGKHVVRKNMIYAIPRDRNRCRVLFRDVVVKKFLAPQEPFSQAMVDIFSQSSTFSMVNKNIVDAIFNQDVEVLLGQQANVPIYKEEKFVLPTESDRLIVEFRKWAKSIDDSSL